MSLRQRSIVIYRKLERNPIIGRLTAWAVYSRPRDPRDEAAIAERKAFMEKALQDRVTALEEQLPRILNVIATCEAELERLRRENEELKRTSGKPGLL